MNNKEYQYCGKSIKFGESIEILKNVTVKFDDDTKDMLMLLGIINEKEKEKSRRIKRCISYI